MAELSQAALGLGLLRFAGTVDGTWTLEGELAAGADVTASLGTTIDRKSDPELSLAATFVVDGTLFDGIDFSALAADGAVALDAAASAAITENLALNPLVIALDAPAGN